MDALTRRQFDRAMFAKERTLAIRVGDYTSRDIKEASFEYGYIKGDTYKPGGTCAGSGKITFTSIITTFNKLDTLHPEIGLLIGDTYQWVKMGEYFINDIEIDRNRNTTTLELMDGMFKLNREYVTDLHFPAEVREVIQEICLKTGIELANDYFGISAMRYHIEQVPEGKKLSFRDMLSAMTQMIGMSCFFNREGKMEIRDLTESNITINADSYFLHGLTKSEIEYQISGITCKTDKKSLTVGMKTGRSLELDNVFMTQSALNDLYYKLKNLTYYPYNLNYQGHLLLEVGQWVTIQTNKKETFKVPVLSQSFTFKGGLRGRISADSKAGNDTQYSYEGTITKQIKQQDGVEAKIQAQIEAADKDFDQKVDKIKKDFNDQVELAKARAEEVKRELSDTINQRFNSFDNGPLKETKRTAEEALRNAGASTLLAQEAKRIGLDSVARLEAFKSQTTSAQTTLSGELDALKRTIVNDIRPKQAQAEAEIAKQAEALSRTKNELAGASTLLAQEAKRIELDSVARLEAFKSQTTSAQTALSGDLDALKRTIANDIRPKQAQAETEIAKQVEALSRTKNELAGVKSAQATYEETTTRRLSELTNLANGKASKSELTQTAEELASRIASVQVGGRNYIRGTKRMMLARGLWASGTFRPSGAGTAKTIDVSDSPVTGFDKAIRLTSSNARDQIGIAQDGFYISQGTYTMSCWVKGRRGQKVKLQTYWQVNDNSGISPIFTLKDENWTKLSFTSARNRAGVASIGYVYLVNAEVGEYLDVLAPQLEDGSLATSSKEAPEDIEGQISTVESTFKQRANSLEAGVNRLTEGLRTKADISALNVTAENIRQSVKSLETDTQNKLNQKLSQAEFEVRAGSIRQEILNATKDKASKSELTQTAEELASRIASVQASGRNLFLNSLFKQDISKTGIWTTSTYTAAIDSESKYLGYNALKIIGLNPSGRDGGNPKVTYPALGQFGKVIPGSTTNQDVTISFYAKANKNGIMLRSRLGNIGYKTGNVTLSTEIKRYVVHIPKGWTNESKQTTNEWLFNFNQEGTVWIWMPKFEISDVDTSYSEAPEDIEGQISTVESTFKQRANSLEAGVNRLTEGLRTKADISALNVTAENIRQSVKSLETDTQNKLNQKLSQAEFEVRAGSIRQEILNATKDKASKSELTQTAEELSSKIASVQVGGRNYIRNGQFKNGSKNWLEYQSVNFGLNFNYQHSQNPNNRNRPGAHFFHDSQNISNFFGLQQTFAFEGVRGEKVSVSLLVSKDGSDSYSGLKVALHYIKNKNIIGQEWQNIPSPQITSKYKRFTFTFTLSDDVENLNLMLFGEKGKTINLYVTDVQLERGSVATDYKEAPEDIEGQISTVESTFKQRANSLEAGVSRLTEGLRTKADISALNVTAENIRQSVKSLETDTQNKLNQKLSQAEFEVRAGSIRQEILNATKDKADKTLVVSEAGKLREEFSKMKVGGRNLWIKSKTVGAVIEKLPENHVTGQKECYRLENNSTLTFNLEPDFSSRLYQKVTFSAWIKYENVVQGRNFWNVFNCFKHYLFRKNSETGVQSGPDYATLGMYKGSADWKYITFTYDYSEKTNFDQLKTSLRFNLEGATSGTAWVTGIKVEIGSVATDWSPAPEDADGLITEAKATFERTAQGLRTDLSAIQEYVNKDGQRQEALQRYTREESTRQATAVRELVNRDFVGKATYQEDVKGINQRIEAVKTSANKDIASQIASYRQSVDGKFTDISSQITTYKQDVGGQISGLSNRLTSSEQGTTTQISNLSNRINSNKQGTDNQISNLKTQVATNKDNAERQMGRISDQVSANKANADSQFANVTNQLARKVETTDFQRVKETSKLYERILGNTENGIADKVARMALTNQLFQVEVGKYSVSGPNLIKNSDFKNATNEWGSTQNLGRLVKHSFYHNGQKDLMRLSNATKNENFLYSHRFNLERNTDYVLNFRGFNNSALASYDVYILGRRAGESDGFTIVKKVVSSKKLSTSRCEDVSVTFNSGEMDNAYIRFDNNGSSSGTADLYITEVDLYKGYKPRTWQPHPEDAVADANKKLEATQTKMTQLAGSWVVENINSAGDIISGINLGANGHNRFVGKLTHITGETLIDRAVIKSAMVDKLKTGNFEAGSVTTTILDAEAVTAEKLKVDNALIRKLTANDAFIDQLISKRIFSIKVESVISSSTFLEAYQGRIGGFTLGQFDQGGGRWISGVNQFSVGMGNGAGYGVRTAFWANWGNNWNYAGPKAWNVNTDGKMYCRNEVGFYDQVDFSNSSRANFYGNTTFSRSPVFSNGIELGSKDVLGDGWNPKGGRNAVVWWNQVGSGSVKYWMEQKSDRRLKENITDTAVKALDKINRLRMVAFDFIENKKHEEIGLIAQEAETIVPRIVSRDPENPDGYLHIDYTALVPYLIKAIQELNQKIEKMEKTIA
ncbi:tail fiber domain-containing protein [Streptococcus pneumoniae]|nr:tail fiber domain-containing protein [Streptococcus pneumoniae]MDS2775104.1 tail fiber domain-containing protein [Streptococcus pneumoniae]MDS3710023.1 tail fiber domain-containing protein [Streptococcus pneumoniae]MDS8158896.1 tail fiber domain-containing protein [Streptococcus pneumoniae]MDS8952755.1 tail fiber domain-containing protein [Streptococcus pneumoniae]